MFVHTVALEVSDAFTDHVPWGKLTSLVLLTLGAFFREGGLSVEWGGWGAPQRPQRALLVTSLPL